MVTSPLPASHRGAGQGAAIRTAYQKDRLMMELTPTQLPLSKLHVSKHNARFGQPQNELALAGLAESILSLGLLHPLVVHPDGEGFGVVAGARRLAAIQSLGSEAPEMVACMVIDSELGDQVRLASLAENMQREAMTDSEVLQALRILCVGGERPAASDGELADALGISETRVRRFIRLSTMAEPILEAFFSGDLELSELTDLARSPHHDEQLRVWEMLTGDEIASHQIKTAFGFSNGDAVKHLKWVGEDAYIAAGGTFDHDLFSDEASYRINDPALLARLLHSKSQPYRDQLTAEREGLDITFTFDRPRSGPYVNYALRAYARHTDEVALALSEARQAQDDILTKCGELTGKQVYRWQWETTMATAGADLGFEGEQADQWDALRKEGAELDAKIAALEETPKVIPVLATVCVLELANGELRHEWWFPDAAAQAASEAARPGSLGSSTPPPPPQPKPGEPDYDPDSPQLTQRAIDFIKGMRSRMVTRFLTHPLSETSIAAAGEAHKALIFAIGWQMAQSGFSTVPGFVHTFAGDSFGFAGSPLGPIDPPVVPGLKHKDAAKGFAAFRKQATPTQIDQLAAWVFARKLQPDLAVDPKSIPGMVLAPLSNTDRARAHVNNDLTADFFGLFTKKVLAGFGGTQDEQLSKDILAGKGDVPVTLATERLGVDAIEPTWLPTFLRFGKK